MSLTIVLLPMIVGVLILALPFQNRKQMWLFMEAGVVLNSLLVWYLILNPPAAPVTFIHFTGNLTIAFQMDGLSQVFAGLVSFLWPFATLYAMEYMTKEEREKQFFMFYTITYGVTLGIATSANIVSMYFFYELLTLVTTPLVIHTLTREAIKAARMYLYYSLGGAAFAFIGMIFVIVYGTTTDFVYGGVMRPENSGASANILYLIYVLAFLGFGVKTAIFPFNAWLPKASVAPTPVTALLHAVAVVKSGAFAIMRLTYYSFGADFLRGSWAQNVVMGFTLVTIVYGCSMALKERHIKRRLAYSTTSNLSYILFGVTIMTPLGLVGALCHLIFHAMMKICSFCCAGAVIHQTERTYVYELDGFGRKMPKVFGMFTIASLAMMGVPGLCGFISKFNLAKAAVESENTMAYVGVAALLVSAILTAIYMLTIVVRAFFPKPDFDYESISDVEDPNWMMIIPLAVFCIAMVYFGLHPMGIISFFTKIANGLQ